MQILICNCLGAIARP